MSAAIDQATFNLSNHIARMIMKNLGGGGVLSNPLTLHFEGIVSSGSSRFSDVEVQTMRVNLVRCRREICKGFLKWLTKL